jgi:hypothetical protein
MAKDFVQKVIEFNEVAGTTQVYNPRKVALYVGLQLEELSEQIASFRDPKLGNLLIALEYHSRRFKNGEFDEVVKNANTLEQRIEFLDGAVDSAVVAIGSAIAIGSNVEKATHAVADNNLSKYPLVDGVRVILKDANGKIQKPPGFTSVNLNPYLK